MGWPVLDAKDCPVCGAAMRRRPGGRRGWRCYPCLRIQGAFYRRHERPAPDPAVGRAPAVADITSSRVGLYADRLERLRRRLPCLDVPAPASVTIFDEVAA